MFEDLQKQKLDYEYALSGARGFSWVQGANDDSFVFTSPVKDILGYDDDYFDGMVDSVRRIIYPPDLPEVERAYEDCLKGAADGVNAECRVIAANGDLVWLRHQGRLAEESSNRFKGVAFDITTQKKLEDRQRILLEILQSQEIKTALALEGAKGFSWEYIPANDELWLSKTAEAALGYPVDYFRNSLSKYLENMAYGHAAEMRKKQDDYASGLTDIYTAEYPFITSTGEVKWYLGRGRYADERHEIVYGVCIDITESKEYEQKLSERAYKDSLTGLYNQQYLADGMITPQSGDFKSFGALLLDIRRFKNINEAFGYNYGDELIGNIAKKIQEIFTDNVIVRVSGNRFLVVFENAVTDELERHAKHVINVFGRPFAAVGQMVGVNFKVGIAVCGDTDVTKLLKDAEIALYSAKGNEIEDYCVLSEPLRFAFKKRVNTEFDLRNAIGRNEFVMYYQPKISVKTKKPIGAEALIRWIHPGLGLVPPLDFIPLAEETGLIMPIGEYVIREVARQLREWLDIGLDMIISFNLSSKQFLSPRLKSQICGALDEFNIPPGKLVIEITESIMISDFDYVNELLRELDLCGIGVSLDDFGTGYSSMSYLGKIPLDYLKIDKSFIDNAITMVKDRAILESIVTMSHKLGFMVTAEGVETGEQFKMLEEFGCDIIQGYYFSKPLAPDVYMDFLKSFTVD